MTVLKNALAVNDGKAVVISIKREWLAKIMSGEKTLEVRKSRPWEISFPFAVFCYETKSNGGAGEIIGAFTCEDIDQLNCLTGLSPYYADGEKLSGMADKFIRESCIDIAALFEYGNKTGMLYGWNISNVRKLSLPMHQLHLKLALEPWLYNHCTDVPFVTFALQGIQNEAERYRYLQWLKAEIQ